MDYIPIGVEWFLYRLHGHGLSVVVSMTSRLTLHCCIQMLDEPHSKNKYKAFKYTQIL